MDFAPSTFWWVMAGVVVAAELTTGTFYLLMIALGLGAGALAAHLGLSTSYQIVAAAAVGGGATAFWHWRRMQHPRSAPAAENRDVNLDVGERVTVVEWAPDRTARISYRGTTWSARLQAGETAAPGVHIVKAVEGNWLILAPLASPSAH
jgi:membrane protein implicated in regulation of membrane protease activity